MSHRIAANTSNAPNRGREVLLVRVDVDQPVLVGPSGFPANWPNAGRHGINAALSRRTPGHGHVRSSNLGQYGVSWRLSHRSRRRPNCPYDLRAWAHHRLRRNATALAAALAPEYGLQNRTRAGQCATNGIFGHDCLRVSASHVVPVALSIMITRNTLICSNIYIRPWHRHRRSRARQRHTTACLNTATRGHQQCTSIPAKARSGPGHKLTCMPPAAH